MASRKKWCFVPTCSSTSIRTPNKVFVCVPRDFSRKLKWFKAVRREMPKSQTIFYCCEDHFDLKEDMQNYMRFTLMGGNILLKDNVVPHIFDGQKDRKRTATASGTPAFIKSYGKQLVEEALLLSTATVSALNACDINESESVRPQVSIANKLIKQSNQNAVTACPTMPSTPGETVKKSVCCRSIAVQVKPHYRSRCTMYNFKGTVLHMASLTTESTTQDQSTSPLKKSLTVEQILFHHTSSDAEYLE